MSEGVWPPVSLHGGHTSACDGSASAAEMIEAAERAGMAVFGLSDHFYRPRDQRYRYPHERDHDDFGRARWPAFVEQVLSARREREERGDRSGLRVLLGAEVDFVAGLRDWTVTELARWPLDYRVISVHFIVVGDEVVPFDISREHWERAERLCGGQVGLYRRYYEEVLEALDWGVGDVLGHLDVIKIFAPSPVADGRVDALIDEVLERCASGGVLLDLNPRGLIKPCQQPYPSAPILERARRLGVGIVTGDDSHSPQDIGRDFAAAAQWAADAGYEEIHLPRRLGGQSWPLLVSAARQTWSSSGAGG